MILKYFSIENRAALRIEITAGAVTFFTMSYILFVQPAVLSGSLFGFSTGMDASSVALATILSSALACIVMGFYAKMPVALAPGMGENFFFVLSVIPAAAAVSPGNAWQTALGTVFLSGILFLILSAAGARKWIMEAVSESMRYSIAGGIGIFIALIGLKNGGIISLSKDTGLALGNLSSTNVFIFLTGLLLTSALHAKKVPGSILIGIIFSTLFALVLKWVLPSVLGEEAWMHSGLYSGLKIPETLFQLPDWDTSTFFALDISAALSPVMIPYIFIFLFMMSFDATGTLIASAERAGLSRNGIIPGLRRAFLTDAGATTAGALFGTSTVTAYIESTAGIEQGGRTGLTAVVTGIFFLSALLIGPLLLMIGSYPPLTAPALILVGAMMMESIRRISWQDITEAVPAFLVLLGIPFSYSISDGIALGLISYPVLKAASGRIREVNAPMAGAFLITAGYLFYLRPSV